MSTMKRQFAALAAVGVLLSGCGGSELDDFAEEVESGASCQALFEIRNGWDPDSPNLDAANRMLQEVGCFSASSERTD